MTTPDSLTINLTTVTPIWTGGVDGKSSQLHMIGILGSLRWWYEAIVRGVGGRTCDPTNPNKPKCSYDGRNPETFKDVCDVCRVFGATGWARRFQIALTDETTQQNPLDPEDPHVDRLITFSVSDAQEQQIRKKGGKPPKWYLNSAPLVGKIGMNVIATGPKGVESTEYFQPEVIGGLVKFIADWGSLGAKPQMGLGVVRITSPKSMNVQPLLNHLKDSVKTDEVPDPTLPSLQDMFFFRVNINNNAIDRMFDLKHKLREKFRYDDESADERDLRHFVMGYAGRNNRIGSKIMMSFPYDNNTVRIWGWIPETTNFGVSQENVMNMIYHYLESEYGKKNILYPHKFNPVRQVNGLKFLEDLLKEQQ